MVSLESTMDDSYGNNSMDSFVDEEEERVVKAKTVKSSRLNLGKMRGYVEQSLPLSRIQLMFACTH